MEEIIQKAQIFVQESLKESEVDSSHDYWHILRVRNLALTLAENEKLTGEQKQIVELSALLHDVKDWKYSGDENSTTHAVQKFLDQNRTLISEQNRNRVMTIIQKIGFKDELKKIQQDQNKNGIEFRNKKQKLEFDEYSVELGCVQDADRLDAIGAIGIARCLTFGGKFNRSLYDPDIKPRENLSKEEYMNTTTKQTTINHFYEKLLNLKSLMKTQSGIQMASERHRFMEEYLERFYNEWDGKM